MILLVWIASWCRRDRLSKTWWKQFAQAERVEFHGVCWKAPYRGWDRED